MSIVVESLYNFWHIKMIELERPKRPFFFQRPRVRPDSREWCSWVSKNNPYFVCFALISPTPLS